MVPLGVVSATHRLAQWLPSIFCLIALADRHSACERVGGGSRLLDVPSQTAQTVIDGLVRILYVLWWLSCTVLCENKKREEREKREKGEERHASHLGADDLPETLTVCTFKSPPCVPSKCP